MNKLILFSRGFRRKSKGFWDLKQHEAEEEDFLLLSSDDPPYTEYNSIPSSDSVIVDLTEITSSDLEIPSDLSIIDDYWGESVDLSDLNISSLTVLDLPFEVKIKYNPHLF